MNLSDIAVGRSNVFRVDPRKLVTMEGLNVRGCIGQDPKDKELLNSIKENGVLEPLLIWMREDKPTVSSGHRRLWAVLKAIEQGVNIESVPCMAAPRGYNEEEAMFDMIRRNDGKPLTLLEQATTVERLMKLGRREVDIAKALGKTQAHVNNLKLLTTLPQPVKDKINGNEIAATLVLDLARQHQGNAESLKAQVEKAVAKAKLAGKKKATKKHTRPEKTEEPVKAEESNNGAPEPVAAPATEIEMKEEGKDLAPVNEKGMRVPKDRFINIMERAEKVLMAKKRSVEDEMEVILLIQDFMTDLGLRDK